jgi:hypothetical protein
MLRFLILCYHGKGHFNPSFHLARSLQKKHEVLFSGYAYFQSYITSQGFSFYPLKTVPFGLGLESWVCEVEKKQPLDECVLNYRRNDHLYRLREEELYSLIETCQPQVVLLDTHQATDFIVLYPILKKKGIRLALIHAMLSGALVPGFPPVNSFALPNDPVAIEQSMLAIKNLKQKRLQQQKAAYPGEDDDTIIRRNIQKNRIPEKYLSPYEKFYGVVLDNLHEFIFLPKEFDFTEAPATTWQHYAGFQIDYDRSEGFTEDYKAIRTHILGAKQSTKNKLVFCSFGTVPLEDSKPVQSFIHKLIQATAEQNIMLFIATSLPVEQADHVQHLPYVPQVDALGYADVFITHGGLNSIKESIDREVPMLVYPPESVMDPAGCATRVVYHELGLRGDIKDDTVEDIQNKIHQLLTDTRFKQSLARLKQKNQAYNLQEAVVILENLPPLD